MLFLQGFRHEWQTDPAAGMRTANAGRARSIVTACGAPIAWGLADAVERVGREVGGGMQFDLSAHSRVELTCRARATERVGRYPAGLMPNVDGTNVDILWDRRSAVPESMRIPLDLGLPAGGRLDFQPPLTQREIDEGRIRPENVVNSWAVFGPADGGTGRMHGDCKLGHIYRSWLMDARGEWTWIESTWDGREFVVLLDERWMDADSRAWPVRFGPFFGNTDIGASSYGITAEKFAFKLTTAAPSADGTLTRLELAVNTQSAKVGRLALYSHVSDIADGRLVETGEVSLDSGSDGAWVGGSASVAVTSGTQYWIGVSSSGTVDRYDSAAGRYYREATYAALPDPWTSTSGLVTAFRVSVRGTFTEGGGAPAAEIHRAAAWRVKGKLR